MYIDVDDTVFKKEGLLYSFKNDVKNISGAIHNLYPFRCNFMSIYVNYIRIKKRSTSRTMRILDSIFSLSEEPRRPFSNTIITGKKPLQM